MSALFYVSGAVAIIAAVMVITRASAMHAMLYLIVALLAVATVFFTLGAPFLAALEVIVYAGAIMILFVFAVMLLNLGRAGEVRERGWLSGSVWAVPALLAGVLLAQFIVTLAGRDGVPLGPAVGPREVGISLYTTYMIGVELASLLLLAALVAAFHFGVLPGRMEVPDE